MIGSVLKNHRQQWLRISGAIKNRSVSTLSLPVFAGLQVVSSYLGEAGRQTATHFFGRNHLHLARVNSLDAAFDFPPTRLLLPRPRTGLHRGFRGAIRPKRHVPRVKGLGLSLEVQRPLGSCRYFTAVGNGPGLHDGFMVVSLVSQTRAARRDREPDLTANHATTASACWRCSSDALFCFPRLFAIGG